MRKLWIVLSVLAGCTREQESATTATIAPADPRPAPTVTATMTNGPMVTTSGSPPPAERSAPGSELVTVNSDGIEMRPLLPRAHTVFHIDNETGSPHQLVLRATTGTASVTVPASGRAVFQATLRAPSYELVCTTPGHSERAQFRTYVAGLPVQSPAPARDG